MPQFQIPILIVAGFLSRLPRYTVRDAIPKAHALATAEFATLRLRLLKLGTRVIETASRVR
jgi:hypothetical protein